MIPYEPLYINSLFKLHLINITEISMVLKSIKSDFAIAIVAGFKNLDVLS